MTSPANIPDIPGQLDPEGFITPQQPEENQPESAVIEPENALPEVRFEQLPERLRQAAARAGWTTLTPVQARAIPYLLARRDLVVQSRTGSGKTGAFLLPIMERIDLRKAACQALVLVPTRELAQQVARDAQTLAGPSDTRDAQTLAGADGMRTAAIYGGAPYGPQITALREGAHLVVGTPGRILDHLLKHSLSLQDLRILVFDEADRMLSMGFYPDMKEIQRYLPDRPINGYMFSATITSRVTYLARQFLQEPELLSLSSDQVHVSTASHIYYVVPAMDKDRSLVRIIEVENPDSALIFCNTKDTVHYLTVVLQRFGYDADELSSDRAQEERDQIMNRIRQGRLRFLVTTDVASRGIDLPELSHVFLYDTPEDAEDYIHRAGRTGRAGASGVVISLVNPIERLKLKSIARRYGIDMQEAPLPGDADVAALVGERMTALLEARLRTRDRVQVERLQRFVPLARELGQNEEGQTLLAMVLDELYQLNIATPIPAPEPLPEKKGGGKRKRRGHRGKGKPKA